MKKLIYIIALLISISCSTREDFYASINSSPVFKLTEIGDTINIIEFEDSIKLGKSYKFSYDVTDEEQLKIDVQQKVGNDSIIIANNIVEFYPKKEGTSIIELKVFDSFNQGETKTATFNCFSNLPPIANFIATKVTGGLNPNEVNIDATSSYDKDKKWGGNIVLYEYKIQTNYITTTSLSSIRYIFESAGQKKIIVRVKDNNGAWSEEKIVYITL